MPLKETTVIKSFSIVENDDTDFLIIKKVGDTTVEEIKLTESEYEEIVNNIAQAKAEKIQSMINELSGIMGVARTKSLVRKSLHNMEL